MKQIYFLLMVSLTGPFASLAQTQSVHEIANTKIIKLQEDYRKKPSAKDPNDTLLNVHPSSLIAITSSLFSNAVLGYDGFNNSVNNGSIKVNSKETSGSVTVGFRFKKSKALLLRNAILAANLNATVKDNVGSIFSGGKSTGGWGAELNYFKMFNSSIFYMKKDKAILREKREVFFNEQLYRFGSYTALNMQKWKDELAASKAQLTALAGDTVKIAGLDRDEYDKLVKKIKNLQTLIADSVASKYVGDSILSALNAYEAAEAKLTGISAHWLQVRLVYRSESYNTIDSSKALFSQQDGKIPFDGKGAYLGYNYFKRSSNFTKHLNASIGVQYKNTFDGVSQISFKKRSYFDSANVQRAYEEDVKAYDLTANTFEEYFAPTASIRYLLFFGPKKSIGLDAFTTLDVDIKDAATKGVWGAGTGIIYSNNDVKENTRFSIELLFQAKNITDNSTEEKKKFRNKLNIGIQFAVPFNQLYFLL